MRPRFEVNDEIRWGKLIKSFATGTNYLTPGGPPIPIPRTLDELKQTCLVNNITVSIPDFHKGLVVIQLSEEVFSIRLPPKTMIEETEQALQTPGVSYAVPTFYNDFYAKTLVLDTPEKRLNFHAARIGDYSIRMCS